MAFTMRRPPRLLSKINAFPHQVDALRAIQQLPYAALFHEQGLGKTKIAIDLMLFWLKEDVVDTVFIFTKKSLIQNWENETVRHSHITPKVLSQNRRMLGADLNAPVLMYVLHYEVLTSNLEILSEFCEICRVGVILDESHTIKNPTSRISTALYKLHAKFCRRVIMTGTPAANRPYDLWAQIRFLDGGAALGHSYDAFKKALDLPHDEDAQNDSYSASLEKTFNKIKEFSIRETKGSSGLVLPSKIIRNVISEMSRQQEIIYNMYRTEMQYKIKIPESSIIDDATDILKRLLRLVQCASNPAIIDTTYNEIPGKFNVLCTELDRILAAGEKVIIWTHFIKNADWLEWHLAKYKPLKVHGKLSIERRNKSISKFMSHADRKILIASPKAAKEGLTLTVANHAIFYDRSFSLDDYLQAQDRIHRISQDKNCFVYNLISKGTIDEWIDSLLYAKYKAAQLVQGDISKEDFKKEFSNTLQEDLREILGCGSVENEVV